MGKQIRTQKQDGFTIIEVVLVLAVTGVMITSLLIGMNSSINTQRYRDAVQTFRSDIQSQYDQLSSVRNERDNTWNCNSNAVTSQSGSASINRGQSGCQMMGRLMVITNSQITTQSVIGYQTGEPAVNETDFDVLKNRFNYGLVPSMKQTKQMEWGTAIAWPKTGVDAFSPQTPRSISILMVKAPKSGQVYTFTTNDALNTPTSNNIKAVMVASSTDVPGRKQRVICVESNGLLTQANMAVSIASRATGTTAVESQTNETMKGIKTEC